MTSSDELLARMKGLHPMMIDLSLDRLNRLLAQLGHPDRKLAPVIHIAGTNGKGSTTAFIRAMLEVAGKRVHVYTSPHLVRFHERIVLASPSGRGYDIREDQLVALIERVEAINAGAPITFFEITTAAALLAFSETPADAVLLEVGLGGRFDATNVVERPRLTVITPVSLDHQDKLGNTLAEIAGEKAGILKRGVVGIIAPQEQVAADVIEARAREVGASLIWAGVDWDAFEQRGRLVYQTGDALMDLPRPALIGRHQIVNAGTAITAVRELRELHVSENAIARGLTEVSWPARMQRLGSGALARLLPGDCELWLDGGHNPAGGAAIAQMLADLDERAPKPVTLIVGMLGTKDAEGFLASFGGLVRDVICVAVPGEHEKRSPEELAGIAAELKLSTRIASDIPEALRMAAQGERAAQRIVICGSLYLAGLVLALDNPDRPT